MVSRVLWNCTCVEPAPGCDGKREKRVCMRLILRSIKRIAKSVMLFCDMVLPRLCLPANLILAMLLKKRAYKHSVLHIDCMVHVTYLATEVLKRHGMKADYMAIGESAVWKKADYVHKPSRFPGLSYLKELVVFWRIVARYEAVHLHRGHTMTRSGWELPLLKRLGRRIIVHYRGCEIRDRHLNMRLHPECNICRDCDYGSYCVYDKGVIRRRELSLKYGDMFLVTTPDMKDFVPEACHLPFFAFDDYGEFDRQEPKNGVFKIVHATNHPGIEGSARIQESIDVLRSKGYPIEFVFLKGVSFPEVMRELSDAHLSIGKMKMGYYANFQIESMLMSVPSVTCIRPEFLTDELSSSGLILSSLDDLERTLEYYITHPEELAKKRKIARESILKIHDNDRIALELMGIYKQTTTTAPSVS